MLEKNLNTLRSTNYIIKSLNKKRVTDLTNPNVPLIGKIVVDNTINKRLNDR